MARAKPKSKSTRKRTRRAGPSLSVPPFVRRGLIALTILVLVLVLVGLGLSRLRAHVNERPEYAVHLDRVRLLERPGWLSDDEWDSIRRDANLEGARGLYDPDLVDDLRVAWGRSPMIAGTPEVVRHHPNRMGLDLTVRRPVVAVWDRDPELPCVLIDREAVVWPGRFPAEPPERFGPLLIVRCYLPDGIASHPTPGYAWRDERVLHGLAVAMELRDGLDPALAAKLKIRVIDVTGVGIDEPDRSEIVLETADDVKIEWGRSPVSPRASRELPLATKIASLRRLFRDPEALRERTVRVRFDPPTIAE